MPKPLKVGNILNGYEVLTHINTGQMAMAYAARSTSGEKVFLKQYKSPSVMVPWYKAYVAYQQELKRRIESNRVRNFSYRMIEFFEADWGCRTFFQIFEFVSGGRDMEKILEQIRTRPHTLPWEKRLILAKVMMAGIAALHDAQIVHCDLKPPNVQLFKDDTIAAGFQLKLIDMDFSILADRRAPWHGHAGYVGSPHYMSPEHVSGQVPLPASDIFTCGLILYELIAHGHPYLKDDDDEYAEHIKAGHAPPPKLAGKMPAPATDEQVTQYLHRCLSPNPAMRPTAKEVNLALNGRVSDYVPPPKPPPTRPIPAPVAPISSLTGTPPLVSSPRVIPSPETADALELRCNGKSLRIGISTEIGNSLCKQLSDDAQYVDTKQFTVERENGDWFIIPNPAARNQTLLNGKALAARTPLKENDIIAVGNEARAVSRMPLQVRFA